MIHVEWVDRIRLTTNQERHVDLSITINDPDVPAKGLNVRQLSTLGTGVHGACNFTVICHVLVLKVLPFFF